MLRRWNLLLMSLCLLVTLVSCDSKDIEKEVRRKEKERIEQQRKKDEEARRKKEEDEKRKKEEEERKKREEEERKKQEEEQKKNEEKRKAEEKRRLKFQSISGIYNGFLTQEGKRQNKPFELLVEKSGSNWLLTVSGSGRYANLELTTEEEDKLVFYKVFIDSYNTFSRRTTVTCYYTPSTKSVRITCVVSDSSPWEFEGTRQ